MQDARPVAELVTDKHFGRNTLWGSREESHAEPLDMRHVVPISN
jgi:hypothetical protein